MNDAVQGRHAVAAEAEIALVGCTDQETALEDGPARKTASAPADFEVENR